VSHGDDRGVGGGEGAEDVAVLALVAVDGGVEGPGGLFTFVIRIVKISRRKVLKVNFWGN